MVPVEALLRVTNGRHKFYELTLPGQKMPRTRIRKIKGKKQEACTIVHMGIVQYVSNPNANAQISKQKAKDAKKNRVKPKEFFFPLWLYVRI